MSCPFLLICKLFHWLSFCFLLLSCFIIEGRIQTHPGNKLPVLHGVLISPFPYFCPKSESDCVLTHTCAHSGNFLLVYCFKAFKPAVRTINNHKYWLPPGARRGSRTTCLRDAARTIASCRASSRPDAAAKSHTLIPSQALRVAGSLGQGLSGPWVGCRPAWGRRLPQTSEMPRGGGEGLRGGLGQEGCFHVAPGARPAWHRLLQAQVAVSSGRTGLCQPPLSLTLRTGPLQSAGWAVGIPASLSLAWEGSGGPSPRSERDSGWIRGSGRRPGCSGVEIGFVEGHREVCRDRCEQKGVESSIPVPGFDPWVGKIPWPGP